MDGKTNSLKVAAIVAAYDEAGTIHRALQALAAYPGFSEVIVVDDGSSDGTAAVAASFGVRVISHPENLGKGKAMATGVAATNAEILFFCDADMYGIDDAMLDSILQPVLQGETEMVIAMRNWRMYYVESIASLIPILGGQRALTRELWNAVPRVYKERFMIETALNFHARYWGRGFQYRVCPGLRQVIKERKYGLWRGLIARARMALDILLTQLRLQLLEVPHTMKTGRIALRNSLGASLGVFIGSLLIIASYRGPVAFVREVFAQELREDPDAPFVHFLLYAGSNIGADALLAIGATLVLANLVAFSLNLKNMRYLAHRPAAVRRVG